MHVCVCMSSYAYKYTYDTPVHYICMREMCVRRYVRTLSFIYVHMFVYQEKPRRKNIRQIIALRGRVKLPLSFMYRTTRRFHANDLTNGATIKVVIHLLYQFLYSFFFSTLSFLALYLSISHDGSSR